MKLQCDMIWMVGSQLDSFADKKLALVLSPTNLQPSLTCDLNHGSVKLQMTACHGYLCHSVRVKIKKKKKTSQNHLSWAF